MSDRKPGRAGKAAVKRAREFYHAHGFWPMDEACNECGLSKRVHVLVQFRVVEHRFVPSGVRCAR